MICLGIESTAHTFGVGVATGEGKILSNVKSVYKPKEGWGIIPMDAANDHRENADAVIAMALQKAGIEMESVDVIAFSQGPGLAPSLYVGLEKASGLSKEYKKPIVGINHCVAHIEIGRLTSGMNDPTVVYTSGANTQILSHSQGRYRCFGETMDVGLGNALDKFARGIGLSSLAGPEIERLAGKGSWIQLPYVVKGMDLSFSGIVTEALKKFSEGVRVEDICFSIQETFFSMLTEVAERALAHLGKEEVLLTGGVAANKRLQEMLRTMCMERNAKFDFVPLELAGDNGGMIAWNGILAHKSKQKLKKQEILPRWRTDEALTPWFR